MLTTFELAIKIIFIAIILFAPTAFFFRKSLTAIVDHPTNLNRFYVRMMRHNRLTLFKNISHEKEVLPFDYFCMETVRLIT